MIKSSKKFLMGASCLFLLLPNIASAEENNIIRTTESAITFNIENNKDILDLSNFVSDVKRESDFSDFTNSINQLNKFAKQKLSQYKVILTDEIIRDYPGYEDKDKYVRGVISFKNGEIVVHNYKYDIDETNHVLYHELGHAIDCYDHYDGYKFINTGKYSERSYFKEIFEEEGKDLKKFTDELYFYDKIGESFAETFSIYLSRPESLKTYAPKLYKYMNDIYNQEIKTGWNSNYNAGEYSYVGEDGKLKKGWFTDPKSNKSYYFNEKGLMERSTIIDGIKLSPSGEALH